VSVTSDSLVGRGHHESYHLYVPNRQIICFLWDEDHDERVFIAASEILRKLSANDQRMILMFGERKAGLTIVTTNENAKESLEVDIPSEIEPDGDCRQVEIVTSGSDLASSSITGAGVEIAGPYLQNLLETRKALAQVWECLELRDIEVNARLKKLS
jgi:hypothetical protein